MPESVTDRCTKSHEYVFLLAKSQHYYYDAEAIREPLSSTSNYGGTYNQDHKLNRNGIGTPQGSFKAGFKIEPNEAGRNKRSVWTLGPENSGVAGHFAVMPTKLVEPCILAGSSSYGACAACGSPWERVVEVVRPEPAAIRPKDPRTHLGHSSKSTINQSNWHDDRNPTRTSTTLGWQPTCTCNADVVPCTVLDPFAGSGTTLAVALKHGRRGLGIELNPDYITLARQRIEECQPLLLDVTA